MSSLRPKDTIAERALAEFLDTYFYPRLKGKDGNSITHERITDRERQIRGIDVILNVRGQDGSQEFRVDEKASLHYGNQMIKTFAFELSSMQGSHIEPIDGWLINDSLLTDLYLLVWPNIKCEHEIKNKKSCLKNLDELTKDDFTILEVMLVRRQKLLQYLEKIGLTKEKLCDAANNIRIEINTVYPDKVDQNKKFNASKGCKYYYTGNLSERPINLLVPRKTLLEVSDRAYLVAEDGCARIK